jgi:hypothetical protein
MSLGWAFLPLNVTSATGASVKAPLLFGSPRSLLLVPDAEKKAIRIPDCFVNFAAAVLDPPVFPLRPHLFLQGDAEPPCLDVPVRPLHLSAVLVTTTAAFWSVLLAEVAASVAADTGTPPTVAPLLARVLLRVTPHSGLAALGAPAELALTPTPDGSWEFDGDLTLRTIPDAVETTLVFAVVAEVALLVPCSAPSMPDVQLLRSVTVGFHSLRPFDAGMSDFCSCFPELASDAFGLLDRACHVAASSRRACSRVWTGTSSR